MSPSVVFASSAYWLVGIVAHRLIRKQCVEVMKYDVLSHQFRFF